MVGIVRKNSLSALNFMLNLRYFSYIYLTDGVKSIVYLVMSAPTNWVVFYVRNCFNEAV